MKIIPAILFLVFPILVRHNVVGQQAKTQLDKIDTSHIDTSRIAVFPFDKEEYAFHFGKGNHPASLSATEIDKIEFLIDSTVFESNKKNGKYVHIEDPAKYYKQLLSIINSHGDKIIWANCLCSVKGDPDWRKNVLLTLDGGTCYFNLKINLSKNITYDFYINNYE